ncbi:hypothetical protein [Streptomyces sp. NPDC058773]|uniref:hypothetical protein n=1 Tax=Streptomyces sp. NPDC058773 TaxID=3346632 RepID=UPI00368F73BC
MKFTKLRSAVAITATLGAAMAGNTAMAASPGSAPSSATHAAAAVSAASGCTIGRVRADETVLIRTSRKVKAAARGNFPKGKRGTTCVGRTTGEKYNLCGSRDNGWIEVDYKGTRGWVPVGCVTTNPDGPWG